RRLTRKLLQFGQAPAADAVVRRWLQEQPDDAEAQWMAAVVQQSLGETDLAQRALQSVVDRLKGTQRETAALQAALLRLERNTPRKIEAGDGFGRPRSKEAEAAPIDNPWGVRFVGDDGRFTPGTISAAEKSKIPPEAARRLADLVELMPQNGKWWALLGDLWNAEGATAAALECFRRAEILQYTSAELRDKRRRLEQAERDQRRAAEERLNAQLSKTESGSPPKPDPDAGWSNLTKRPLVAFFILLGAGLVAAIAVLQIREWLRRPRRR
ncbi:MAG: hypothetical protein ACRC1K_24120, partial [Planctomycetia bacterium]